MELVDAAEEEELRQLGLTRQLIDQGVTEIKFVISQHHGFRSVSYVLHISDALSIVRCVPRAVGIPTPGPDTPHRLGAAPSWTRWTQICWTRTS